MEMAEIDLYIFCDDFTLQIATSYQIIAIKMFHRPETVSCKHNYLSAKL